VQARTRYGDVFYATAQVVRRAVNIFVAEGCVHISKNDSVWVLQ
jgi:hypothetical protein